MSLLDFILYYVAIWLLVEAYVIVVFSPFLVARLVMGRWPWPLGEGFTGRVNRGPMRPNDGMMWDESAGSGRSPGGPAE